MMLNGQNNMAITSCRKERKRAIKMHILEVGWPRNRMNKMILRQVKPEGQVQ